MKPLTYIFLLLLSLTFACSSDKTTSETGVPQIPTGPTSAKCNQAVEDYSELVDDIMAYTQDLVDGKEKDQAKEKDFSERGEALGKKLQSMGLTTLSQNCAQKFANLQMQYGESMMKLAMNAYQKGMEQAGQ